MSLSENIKVDDATNIATIFGVKMSGEFLEGLTRPSPPDVWFRLVSTAIGGSRVVGVETYRGQSPTQIQSMLWARIQPLRAEAMRFGFDWPQQGPDLDPERLLDFLVELQQFLDREHRAVRLRAWLTSRGLVNSNTLTELLKAATGDES